MRNQSGFTLLELIVSITAMAVFGVIVTAFFANAMIGWTKSFAEIQLQEDYQAAADRFVSDMHSATAVKPSSQFGGSYTTNATQLVLAVPARDSSNNFLYYGASRVYICKNEVVYYVGADSISLWRRTYVNNVSGCDAAAGNTGSVDNNKLIEKFTNFSFIDPSETSFPWGSCLTPTGELAGVKCASVKLSLTTQKTAFGKNYSHTGSTIGDMPNKQVYENTYYFDSASPTDTNNAWTNDANASDGAYTSTASASLAGSASSNYLAIPGLNAPSPYVATQGIYEVSARIYGCGTGGNLSASIYEDGTSTSLGTATVTVAACGTPAAGNWTVLSTHSGGWTFAKVGSLDARVYAASASMQAGIVELRVRYI